MRLQHCAWAHILWFVSDTEVLQGTSSSFPLTSPSMQTSHILHRYLPELFWWLCSSEKDARGWWQRALLVLWAPCSEQNLQFNVAKTKKLVMDIRRNKTLMNPAFGHEVCAKTMNDYNNLVVHGDKTQQHRKEGPEPSGFSETTSLISAGWCSRCFIESGGWCQLLCFRVQEWQRSRYQQTGGAHPQGQ